MAFKDQVDLLKIPKHIAIIMDGNGRWAKGQGKLRVFGHHNGVVSVRDVVEASVDIGLDYLTLYAFSAENWNRPKLEVTAIMELLINSMNNEIATFMKNNVRLNLIGNLEMLPRRYYNQWQKAIAATSANTGLVLTLAISYGSRLELIHAAKSIAAKVCSGEIKMDEINEETISENLYTARMTDPELLIRTSGEYRISNFLLWQIAYAELYFSSKLWPDFRREDLFDAIVDYQKRERRFGMTSDQLN
jgi:undecaprenyl diphosphate synthase